MTTGFFWWWVCMRGCSIRTEAATTTLPAEWRAWRCPYDGTPLQHIMPGEVPA